MTAVYLGDGIYSSSTSAVLSQTVNSAPPVTLAVARNGTGSGTVVSTSPLSPSINCGVTCSASYAAGTVVILSASASAGSSFGGWSGGGCSGTGSCQVTMNAPVMVSATFNSNVSNLPGAPQNVSATPGDGQATFFFSPPASDGGSPILSYTASCSGGPSVSGSGSPLTLTGLANGKSYACMLAATNANGTGPGASVNVTPSQQPLALVAVVSRKTHAAQGTFNLPIDTTQDVNGAITVEPRAGSHTIVFLFDRAVTSATPSVRDAANNPVGSSGLSVAGSEVTVPLSGIPDNQRVTVTLSNVNGTALTASAAMGFLVGDVNNTKSVTASDILQTKGRSGTANSANYLYDTDLSGTIDATDVSAVKQRAGVAIP